jgi:hypothetical protein
MTEKINEIHHETVNEIQQALSSLELEEVDLKGCWCIYKSHGQRCDCFSLFNPEVPKYSTAHIFSGKKLQSLVDDDIFDVKEIPEDFPATKLQKEKIDLQKTGLSKINKDAIKKTFSKLEYPLYFFDYETFGKAIPILDGYKVNQQVTFQYSLHVMEENGKVKHFEYLAEDLENASRGLVESMKKNIGPKGNVVVWCEGFEKGRNVELMELHPEYKEFLEDINSRIFDLMKVFQKDYLHPKFYGSASIKNVLPIMVPELSYKELEVQNGTMALEAWGRTVMEEMSKEEKDEIRKNLLKYCELDTLAMVEIFKKLKDLL